MTAPTIKMIAASLRGCSLTRGGAGAGGGGGEASPEPSSSDSSSPATPSPPHHLHRSDHLAEARGESAGGVTVDLNSETALPYYWEQRLDLRTGDLYYINGQTGVRTSEDPRTSAAASSAATVYHSTYCYSADEDDDEDDDDTSLDDDSSSDIAGYGSGEYDDSADSSSISTLSTPSPPGAAFAEPSSGHQVLVAAGCKSCFMYFMVPKHVNACPKCGGGGLLHLGRNGCV